MSRGKSRRRRRRQNHKRKRAAGADHAADAVSEGPAEDAPIELLCPITLELMTDPVVLVATGQTYQRAAIRSWLTTTLRCPLTNVEVSADEAANLAVDTEMRSLVSAWAAATGSAVVLCDVEDSAPAVEDTTSRRRRRRRRQQVDVAPTTDPGDDGWPSLNSVAAAAPAVRTLGRRWAAVART